MPAERYHDFPLAPRDRRWDASEAVPRLRRWASRDGSGEKDTIDWRKYQQVFFWHAENPSDFGDFKLPYCDIINGQPHVVHNACANAKARLPNTDIPSDEKEAVARVIDRQLERFQDSETNARREDRPANDAVFGVPTDEELVKINKLTKRPFLADELFVFKTKMIGDALIPGRYIKISKGLLEVFVKDAREGNVAFMLNHRWSRMFDVPKGVFNLGRVFDSWLAEVNDVPGETVAQFGSVYIPRGRVKDGVNTDEVIQSIEDGSLRDVSVGIGWERSVCSVCGNDYFSRKCEHFAGQEYDGKLCYVIAQPPGDQFELSGVFAGAYPTAEVLSEIEQATGMEPVSHVEDLKTLEEGTRVFALYSRNNINLWVPKDAAKKRASFVATEKPAKEGGEKVDEVKEMLEQTTGVEQTTAVQDNPSESVDAKPDGIVLDRKAVVEALGKEMDADTIIRLAKDGLQLRAELIEDTLEWGVRAQGNAFAREFYYEMLSEPGRTIEGIKNLREQFKAQAKEALKPGRQTQPRDKTELKRSIPDEAFKA